ncbi:MAG TPA: hypothetical protein VIL32_09730 [Steroidobacteraceae bacterium]
MTEMLNETLKGTSEDTELVELGDASETTKGPGFGSYLDPNALPRPWL